MQLALESARVKFFGKNKIYFIQMLAQIIRDEQYHH